VDHFVGGRRRRGRRGGDLTRGSDPAEGQGKGDEQDFHLWVLLRMGGNRFDVVRRDRYERPGAVTGADDHVQHARRGDEIAAGGGARHGSMPPVGRSARHQSAPASPAPTAPAPESIAKKTASRRGRTGASYRAGGSSRATARSTRSSGAGSAGWNSDASRRI